ncbi:MAG: mevalonate kinase [Deltaproteobacteria bacterium]|nr:mevalonate kinase [Deltaproteobacteria bacterium]
MIHTSAPAKIILFGEHASRHGKPSMVFAIDQRLHAYIEPRDDGKIFISSPDVGVENAEYPCDSPPHVVGAIKIFFEETGKVGGFNIRTKSEMKQGFGSSGASVVATLGALNTYFKTNLSKEQIFKMGQKTIWEVQGFGSGIDIASSTYGGIIKFQKDATPEPINFKDFPVVIGNTGFKAKSKPIIEKVQVLEKRYPDFYVEVYNNIGRLTDYAINAFKSNDLETIGQLMNANQGMLYSLGVSSDILEKLIFASKSAGALGVKLSGAGVGDNMIALASPGKQEEIAKAIESVGGKPTIARIDDGLRVEEQ